MKNKFLALVVVMCMALTMVSGVAMAVENDAADPDTINIPVTKVWEGDEGQERPESITVELYKGETRLGETTITADETGNWEGVFTVNKSVFSGNTAKTYDLTLSETALENYTPTNVVHPQVKYTPFTIGEWNRTEECDIQNFDLGEQNAVVAKKGNDYVVWTENELTNKQKEQIFESVKNIRGMGGAKIDNFAFIYGSSASHNGLSIEKSKLSLSFDTTSNWSFWACSSYELEKVEVESGTITNTYKKSDKISINVQKEWEMNGLDNIAKPHEVTIKLFKNNEETGKTLTLNQRNQWKGTFANLDEGVYSIEEVKVEGYSISTNETDGGFTVKNTLITYPVQIKKQADGLPNGTKYPDVTVDIKQGDNVIMTIYDLEANGGAETVHLPAGEYTVEEQIETADVDGYNLDVTNANFKVIAPEKVERSTAVDAVEPVATAIVTNKYTKMEENTGSLIVKKMVSGGGASYNKEFTFTVTLTENNDPQNGEVPYGGVTFTDGVATFTLKHNQEKSITGIPAGYTYTVTENADGYTQSITSGSATGTIEKGKTATVTFNNYKSGGDHYYPTPDPVPPIFTPPRTGDMTIWQSILHFLGIR